MSLENAPDEVKLAVDLIVLLEENRLPARTVLRALEIVMRDYENKLKKYGRRLANRVIALWFVLVVADRVVATVRQQGTGHGTSTHHAARCGISTNADAKRGRPRLSGYPLARSLSCNLRSGFTEAGVREFLLKTIYAAAIQIFSTLCIPNTAQGMFTRSLNIRANQTG